MMKVKGMRDSAAVMNRFFGNVYDLIANCFLRGGPETSRNPHKTVNVGTKKKKKRKRCNIPDEAHKSREKIELKIQVKKKNQIVQ